jgi:chorismate mutase / prephenate dehydratase
MTTPNLDELRKKIDNIDETLQTLITERAEIAQEVARAKHSKEAEPNFYRPEREAEILRRVLARHVGPLPESALTVIFREIISACLSLQKPLEIAYLGPEGTYSQAATIKHFGHSAQTTPVQTIEEVFREVETDRVQYGVVPVENSTEGGVNQTLDCFMSSDLKICGEIELPIHHCLLSQTTEIAQIIRVYSHQQSLAQCRSWLTAHLPGVECVAVSSNAEAARRTQDEPKTAAIAGINAADRYELTALKTNIEDYQQNTTRFAVLGKHSVPCTGRDKSSFLLSAAQSNHSGALLRLLKPFSDNGLNLTRIESRPSRQNLWEYVFFVDLDGHIDDEAVKIALQALTAHASLVKHLGSYPRAIV